MRGRSLPLLLVVLLLVALVPSIVHAVDCTVAAQDGIVLNLRIPGLETCSRLDNDGVTRTYSVAEGFSQYLVTFYTWFAGAAGTLAVFMVMFGGFRWVTAAGNAGRIGEAKETITSAIVGLILLLGSYVLLNTISPQLVTFKLYIPKVTGVPLGSATCYDNVATGTTATSATTATGGATSGATSGAASCQLGSGACSPLQNATCGTVGSGCGCVLSCAEDEEWINYAYCVNQAEEMGPGKVAVFAARNPTAGPVYLDRPQTWGDVMEAYDRATGQKRSFEGIQKWLIGLGTVKTCQWLWSVPPIGTSCVAAAVVLGQFNALNTQLPQPSDLVVGGNSIICCRKKSDTTQCTARSAAAAKSGYPTEVTGTCETDVSASLLPCRDSTTQCGTVNPTGTDTKGTTGCYGVACSTPGDACIVQYNTGKRSVPSYGGCQPGYDEGLFSSNIPFDSGAQCGLGTPSSTGGVGSSCGAGGNCVFINGYVGKWKESSYYNRGKCDNGGALCTDNADCGGGTCVGGGYRTTSYDDPEGACGGTPGCAWERGGVQCYPNQ